MNDIIVMACDAVLKMIDTGSEERPKIVELGRGARARFENNTDFWAHLESEAARWDLGREEILKAAEAPDVSPEFRALLQKMDEAMKKVKYTLSKKKK